MIDFDIVRKKNIHKLSNVDNVQRMVTRLWCNFGKDTSKRKVICDEGEVHSIMIWLV